LLRFGRIEIGRAIGHNPFPLVSITKGCDSPQMQRPSVPFEINVGFNGLLTAATCTHAIWGGSSTETSRLTVEARAIWAIEPPCYIENTRKQRIPMQMVSQPSTSMGGVSSVELAGLIPDVYFD